jgi:hypothetical protein
VEDCLAPPVYGEPEELVEGAPKAEDLRFDAADCFSEDVDGFTDPSDGVCTSRSRCAILVVVVAEPEFTFGEAFAIGAVEAGGGGDDC